MGIAKSAQQVTGEQTLPPQASHSTEGLLVNNVPIDVYRVFNEEIENVSDKDMGKLVDIYEWAKAKCEEPTIGNIISYIRNMENHLGAPALTDKRYYKLWRYVKISRNIDDLDKEREALKKQWAF